MTKLLWHSTTTVALPSIGVVRQAPRRGSHRPGHGPRRSPLDVSQFTGPSDAEVAWAAGLFEGEGCLGVYRRRDKGRSTYVLAKLASTDRDVVERFQAIVRCGSLHKPRKDPRPNHKSVHTWVLYEAAAVRGLVVLLMPWFGERRLEKARAVLAAAEGIQVHSAERTHCPKGHPYSGSNLGLSKETRSGRTTRYCKACRRGVGK